MSQAIPFVDLGPQLDQLDQPLREAERRVLASRRFILGPELQAFEREWAGYCGAREAVGVASGTDALHLALRALGVGPGDEVITVSFTFAATGLAIAMTGATPVFVDVDPVDLLIDPEAAAAAVTPRTRAIIAVHLYGRCADMNALRSVARTHGLALVEDAAQAHGSELGGQRAGTLGDVACFSFYPSKNLGALGDAGAVVTDDRALADRVRSLRNYAQSRLYHHDELGFNSRLDELQAAYLRAKLPHLSRWNEERQALAARYTQLLSDGEVTPPREAAPGEHAFHLYVVRCADRDRLMSRLRDAGIGCQVHYPVPSHRQPALVNGPLADLPHTDRAADEVLSLPLYVGMGLDAVERVAEAVHRALDR